MPPKIRVLITDDHAIVRKGIRALLATEPDIEVVGEAGDGAEAVAQAQALKPDVVLMDLVMPKMDGAAATKAIRAACPQIQVIALTSFEQQDLVQGALQAGAIGYLLKNVSAAELAAAIRAAAAGRPTLAPEAAQALINAATQPPAPGGDLTAREREVLALMVDGLNNPDIAERLVVTHSTTKWHVLNIYGKLGVHNRTHALTRAQELGLLQELQPRQYPPHNPPSGWGLSPCTVIPSRHQAMTRNA